MARRRVRRKGTFGRIAKRVSRRKSSDSKGMKAIKAFAVGAERAVIAPRVAPFVPYGLGYVANDAVVTGVGMVMKDNTIKDAGVVLLGIDVTTYLLNMASSMMGGTGAAATATGGVFS